MQPTLVTRRLELGPFASSDAARVQQLAGDARIADMTEIPHPYEDGMAETWIASLEAGWQAGEDATFAVRLRDTGALIGCCGVHLSAANRRASLGYWIGVEYWRRGFASEAATAVVRFAIDELGIHRVQATHLTRNPASGAVMRRAGLSLEATMRDYVFKHGRFEDMALYALIA